MRGILITLISVAALASAGKLTHRSSGCPSDHSVHLLLEHEKCDLYYRCTFGIGMLQKCPNGLLFNPNLMICDWPFNVNCEDRVVPEDMAGEAAKPTGICADDHDGRLLIAHEHCNKFYKCVNKLPVVVECPVGLYFNPESTACDWPANVDCESRIH